MKIIADTNTFLAVALNEPERTWLIEVTNGHDLAAPTVLPYEIGNALSSLARRKVVTLKQLPAVWDAVAAIPVELTTVDTRAALLLAGDFGIYAYSQLRQNLSEVLNCVKVEPVIVRRRGGDAFTIAPQKQQVLTPSLYQTFYSHSYWF